MFSSGDLMPCPAQANQRDVAKICPGHAGPACIVLHLWAGVHPAVVVQPQPVAVLVGDEPPRLSGGLPEHHLQADRNGKGGGRHRELWATCAHGTPKLHN